jgi:hypothetical protein
MFICTFNEEVKKELDKELKLVQTNKLNGKIIYIYMFDKKIYSRFSNKDIFISNKLYF